MPFRKGFPCEEKECGSFFGAYRSGEKKNYNPSRAKMLWVEVMQVVCVPRVVCFDPFFVEQPVNS
jgi:hypothetical protein